MSTLLNTTDRADAGFCGYDGPTDPDQGGLIVTRDADGWIVLNGSDGEIKLPPQAARRMAEAILGSAQAGRRAA